MTAVPEAAAAPRARPVKAAKALARAPVRVTLVDKRNFHLFQPLLYQVATASLAPSDIAYPIRSILRDQKNTTVLLDEADSIDLEHQLVRLSDRDLTFDYLIVAAGSQGTWFGHDEWAPFAPGLKTMEEALDNWRKTVQKDSSGNINVYGLRWGQGTYFGDYELGIVRRSAGPKGSPTNLGVAPDGITFKGYMDTPEAIKSFEFIRSWFQGDQPVSQKQPVQNIWFSKQAAFYISPDNAIGTYNQLYPNGDFNYGVTGIHSLEYKVRPPVNGRYAYYPGTTEVPEASAARTLGVSFKILAEVEFTRDAQGVIVSQGSRFGGYTLFVNTKSSGAKTVQEFIDYGRRNQGKLTYASLGSASSPNLVALNFETIAKMGWREIPFKSGSDAVNAVVNGTVDAYFAAPATALAEFWYSAQAFMCGKRSAFSWKARASCWVTSSALSMDCGDWLQACSRMAFSGGR